MLNGGNYFNSMMILSGSPGSANDFIEKLTQSQLDDPNNTRVKVYNTPLWDVMKYKLNYSGVTFKVFIGNDSNEPKILQDKEVDGFRSILGDDFNEFVIDVPIEYKKDFEDDLYMSIRDLAGKVTRSTLSYITNIEKFNAAFSLVNKIFTMDIIKLPFFDNSQIQDYMECSPENFKRTLLNPDAERFIHIDLGIVNDLTGISMCHVADYVETSSSNGDFIDPKKMTIVKEPWYVVDFAIGISRPNNEETNITKIKKFILFLFKSGIKLSKVTMDGYQSTQLRQDLLSEGVPTEIFSVIRNSAPFDVTRNAIYQSRLSAPRNKTLMDEFKRFKKVYKGNTYKVYYERSQGSISHGDITESLVGSIYSAYMSTQYLNGRPYDYSGLAQFYEEGNSPDFKTEDEIELLLGL